MGINEPYTSIGQNGLVKFFRKELLLKQILLLNRSRVLAITTFENLVHMKEIYIFCPTTEIRASKLLLNGIQIPNPYRGGGRALGWPAPESRYMCIAMHAYL